MKLLPSLIPEYLVQSCFDVDVKHEIPSYMDNPITCIPDWFYSEQFFTNLLNKNPYVDTHYDPEYEARRVFREMEERCVGLDKRFDTLLSIPNMRSMLERWSFHVRKLMGPVAFGDFPFSSGATTSVKTGNTPIDRISDGEITYELFEFIMSFGPPPRDFYFHNKMKFGSARLEFVPKTAKTHRVICIEPSYNAGFQRGIGLYLSKRLKRFGINLSTAPDTHAFFAMWASMFGDFTTDDLTSASHLIYIKLVEFLVSPDWYVVLKATRSSTYKDKDMSFDLHHFMPNGNGYCFELETIIFQAMLRACAERVGITDFSDILTFGDDLLYPTKMTNVVRAVCKNIGFITNVDKSFSNGFFRESCGGDYLNGHYIRPIYLKSGLSNSFEKTCFANRILEGFPNGLPYNIRRFWVLLVRSIPASERLWGPRWMGNVVLHDRHNRPDRRVNRGKYRDTIKVFVPKPRETTNFGEVANQGLPSVLTTQLALHPSYKGWGDRRVVYKKCYEAKWHVTPSVHLFIILGIMLKNKELIVKDDCILRKRIVYPQMAKPGTGYTYHVDKTGYYEYPSLIDEQEPLSIFDVLSTTNAPSRLYSKDYFKSLQSDKKVELSNLLELLRKRLTNVEEKSIDLSRQTLVIDYVDF